MKQRQTCISVVDDLLNFIQRVARGHRFEPYCCVEETQILKAFQAYLANAPAAYIIEEREALPSSVHDWDGPYSVSVSHPASEVESKRDFKKRATEELVRILSDWRRSKNTFEQTWELEPKRFRPHIDGKLRKEKGSALGLGDFQHLSIHRSALRL